MDNPAPADSDAMYRRPTAAPPTLPSISDYWPDAPHRIGPPADHYSDEPTRTQVDALLRSGRREPEPSLPHMALPVRKRSRRPLLVGLALAAVLVTGAGAAAFVLTGDIGTGPQAAAPAAPSPTRTAAPAPADTSPIDISSAPPSSTPPAKAAPRSNVVSGPAADRDKASFELVSDTVTIELKAAALGEDLYRISTPSNGSVLPRAEVRDAGVKLFLDETGKRGDSAVTVLLNADVRWSMKITGGVRKGIFDLGAARVDGVTFAGGAARIDLTVPRPEGTLPIRMSGGVNRFEVYTDQGVPVRVRTRRGAGQVQLDGRTDDGVAKGASFLSPDWAGSENRIDLDAVAGVGTLRVGRG